MRRSGLAVKAAAKSPSSSTATAEPIGSSWSNAEIMFSDERPAVWRTLEYRRESHYEEPQDAKYAIERLLAWGWFYEVDGDRRVTDAERTLK